MRKHADRRKEKRLDSAPDMYGLELQLGGLHNGLGNRSWGDVQLKSHYSPFVQRDTDTCLQATDTSLDTTDVLVAVKMHQVGLHKALQK